MSFGPRSLDTRLSLRSLFLWIVVLGIVLAAVRFAIDFWFEPREVGMEAQERIAAFLMTSGLQGQVSAYFWEDRIMIQSDRLGDEHALELARLLADVTWLQLLELRHTRVTEKGVATIQSELPKCNVLLIDLDSGLAGEYFDAEASGDLRSD